MGVTVNTNAGSASVSTNVGSASVSTSFSATTPTTFAELVSLVGRGYPYTPPSGIETSYYAGDDSDNEDNVWTAARLADDVSAKNSLASFFVLNNNNSFGNTNRFTDVSGGQTYSDSIIVDNYTGISYYYVASIVSWTTYHDNAAALSQGGFSDWLTVNRPTIESIVNIDPTYSPEVLSYTPFSITMGSSQGIWTSSSVENDSTRAYELTRTGFYSSSIKSVNRRQLYCRKHF